MLITKERVQEITGVRYSRDYWFVCVDTVVLLDEELSRTEKMVFTVLCEQAGLGSRLCKDDVEPVADILGIPVKVVRKSVSKLEAKGIIERFEGYIYLVGHNAPCYSF